MTQIILDKNLNELFSLPIGASQIAQVGGVKMYSSSSLRANYIDAMKSTSKTKDIGLKIEQMVGKKQINPAWLSDGLYALIKHKVFGEAENHIMGFYTTDLHKIFILMDNNINFGFASNLNLANLTLHEGMHMAAKSMGSSFLSSFRSEFTSYYSELIRSMFAITQPINSKEIQMLYTFLFNEFEKGKGSVLGFLRKYYTLISNTFSKYSDNKSEFDNKLKDMITFIALFLKGDVAALFMSLPNYRHIVMPLYSAYANGLGGTRLQTVCIQELLFPSEVICIYSSFTKNLSKIHSVFKKI